MQINTQTFDMTTYQHDFGDPVFFTTKSGFEVGETIVIAFEDNRIGDTVKEIEELPCRVEFKLSEAEAASFTLDDDQGYIEIPYSIKHYRAGVCLDTIVNAKLIVWRTVPWQPNS